MSACIHHPDLPATSRCSGCGRLFCAGCVVEMADRPVCAACKHAALAASFRVYAAPMPDLGSALAQHGAHAAPGGHAAAASVVPDCACTAHPQTRADAVCERCGDFICALCLTPFEGRSYCLRCFELLWRRSGMRLTPPVRYYTHVFAMIAAAGAWVCSVHPLVSWALAAGGLVLAGVVLRQTGRDPALPGRPLAWAAIVTALSSLFASIGIAWLFWAAPW